MFHQLPDRSRKNLVAASSVLHIEDKEVPPDHEQSADPSLLESKGGPEPAEPVEPCFAEVLQVLEALEKNTPLTQVAAFACGDSAFGIGHMLHYARRRNLLKQGVPLDILAKTLCQKVSEISEKGYASRILAIRGLRDLQLVDPDVPDRSLKPAGTTPCIRSIATLMEDLRSIPFDTIISASRGKIVVRARFETIWVMRQVCGHSLTVIGKNVGGRDHTTVLNSLNKMNLEKMQDSGVKDALASLCEKADLIGIQKNRKILARQAMFAE